MTLFDGWTNDRFLSQVLLITIVCSYFLLIRWRDSRAKLAAPELFGDAKLARGSGFWPRVLGTTFGAIIVAILVASLRSAGPSWPLLVVSGAGLYLAARLFVKRTNWYRWDATTLEVGNKAERGDIFDWAKLVDIQRTKWRNATILRYSDDREVVVLDEVLGSEALVRDASSHLAKLK